MSRDKSAGGRPQDQVWKHVERLEDGKWKCNYCGRVYSGSASRIRNHLSNKGNDIASCQKVPREIQDEVSRRKPNKKRRSEEDNEVGSRVVASDSITPPLQVASSSAEVAPPQPVSSLNVQVNNVVEERQGMMNNCMPDVVLVSTTTPTPFQQVSPSSYLNVDVPVGAPEMSSCVSDGVWYNTMSTTTPFPGSSSFNWMNRRIVDAISNDAHAVVGMASAPLQVQDLPPSSSNDLVSITKLGAEESVINAFLKFLMCNNFLSVDADLLKDSYLREFFERAHQRGVPSSLLRGDSIVIEKSLMNIKQEVCQYMSMVKESWKTTGCTLMAFHLNHGYKGKVFTLGQDKYVYGFYCPKGFIFVEAPDCDKYTKAFYNALEQHSPSLSSSDVWSAIFLHHSISYGLGDDHLCELSDKKLSVGVKSLPCLRHEIQGLCIDTCRRSEWAQRLINRAIEIHEHLSHHESSSLCRWYLNLIMKTDEDFKKIEHINGQDASPLPNFLSNFISFMLLERKLKKKLSYETRFGEYVRDRPYLEAILDDSKLWDDGRDLFQVLTMTLGIPGVMDTLVPTAGYLAATIDLVNDIIKIDKGVEANAFWKALESKLRDTIEGKRAAASYLNSYYFVDQDVQKQAALIDKLKLEFTVENGYYNLSGKEEKLHEELQLYDNICNKQYEDKDEDEDEYEIIHPVKWWEKYGDDLPLLREQAIKLLSQPLTCMCNQVKKHIYELQGADDFILRLNVRMMEKFKRLGDDIYMPSCYVTRNFYFLCD